VVSGGVGAAGNVNAGGFLRALGGLSTLSAQSPFIIQYGTISIGSVSNGSNVGPFTATFNTPFSVAPQVVAISNAGSGGENVHYMCTPTTTNFAIRAKNSGNSASGVIAAWLAIGLP